MAAPRRSSTTRSGPASVKTAYPEDLCEWLPMTKLLLRWPPQLTTEKNAEYTWCAKSFLPMPIWFSGTDHDIGAWNAATIRASFENV